LNRRETPLNERIDLALTQLPAPILNDIRGSAAYREHVLKLTLEDALKALGGE
jgi:CO/xanthine dehydrogenase FAD-binding subunit